MASGEGSQDVQRQAGKWDVEKRGAVAKKADQDPASAPDPSPPSQGRALRGTALPRSGEGLN